MTKTEMTKTEALKRARREVLAYQSGSGWVVSTYCPKTGAWHPSSTMTYWAARRGAALAVAERALSLMGLDQVDVADVADRIATADARHVVSEALYLHRKT